MEPMTKREALFFIAEYTRKTNEILPPVHEGSASSIAYYAKGVLDGIAQRDENIRHLIEVAERTLTVLPHNECPSLLYAYCDWCALDFQLMKFREVK